MFNRRGKARVGRLSVGSLSIAVVVMANDHADRTLTNDEMKCNIIRLTGTADQGFNVVFNTAWTNYYVIHNATGQTATLKNAAGATTTIVNGAQHLIFNTGTDIVKLV